MAFRIPIHYISEQDRINIQRDLHLKDRSFNFAKGKRPVEKFIDFWWRDEDDLVIPMMYASDYFKTPFINLRRNYDTIQPFNINFTLRDYQEEVIDKSLNNFNTRGTTFLNVFCSFGKTVVGAYLAAVAAKTRGLATLVTYPRTIIEESWIGTFQTLTDAKIYVVGLTKGEPDDDTQIFLCMNTRLHSLPDNIKRKVGHFIVDEAHMFCTAGHVIGLLSIEPIYLTILTATYERDDGLHCMIDLMAGPDRIKKISKKPFYVYQRITNFTAEPDRGPRGILFDSLLRKLSEILERNEMILAMIADNMHRKPLIITRHKDHANNLTNWLEHWLPFWGKTVTKISGTGKKFQDADVIVATISKAGVGFDESHALIGWNGIRSDLLILTASTKKIEQIAGRVFRADNPVIFDIVDDYENCRKHWNARRKWYEERNGKIYTVPGLQHFTIPEGQPVILEKKSEDSHAKTALRYLAKQ